MNGNAVLHNVTDGIAEIRFNKPEKLNALDIELAQGFDAAVDAVLADTTTRVIVLSAAGRAFVAGGDLAFLRSSDDKGIAARQLIHPVHSALRKLAEASQITLGRLKGPVAGGGMSLALNLDLLVAAEDATFNFAYARVAASPDCGGSWALPRLVGLRKALEIALLCDTIDATEALRLGLVNRVVATDRLEDETMKLARRLANAAPVAQARIKSLLRTSSERTYRAQLDAEEEGFAACAATEDFATALDAFFERRTPVFLGR